MTFQMMFVRWEKKISHLRQSAAIRKGLPKYTPSVPTPTLPAQSALSFDKLKAFSMSQPNSSILSSPLSLLIVLALFTISGGLLFVFIEGPFEEQATMNLKLMRHQFKQDVQALWQRHAEKYFEDAKLSKDFILKVSTNGMPQFVSLLNNYEKALESAMAAGYSMETKEAPVNPPQWNLWSGMFYAFTVYSTIGYGNIYPRTQLGQAVSVIYGLLGIPLCLVVLSKLGQVFNRLVKAAWHRCVRRNAALWTLYGEVDEQFDYPIPLAFLLVAVYILLGAFLYSFWENWSLSKAAYFTFVSLSTIGFGDVLPNDHRFFLFTAVYLCFGLSLVGMLVNQLVERMESFLRPAKQNVD